MKKRTELNRLEQLITGIWLFFDIKRYTNFNTLVVYGYTPYDAYRATI